MRQKCRRCRNGYPYCHRCPDMNGGIMPGCGGTACLARHEKDKSYCTCPRPKRIHKERTEIEALRASVAAIEKTLAKLGAA